MNKYKNWKQFTYQDQNEQTRKIDDFKDLLYMI